MNLVVSAIVMCLVLMAAPASAEWYADVYAGQSLTLNDDVTVHSPAGLGIYRDVEFDQSLSSADDSGGIWIACPFSAWASTPSGSRRRSGRNSSRSTGVCRRACNGPGGTGRIDVTTIAVSPELLLRLPLFKSEKAPWGALQPYISAGVPVFVTTVTPRTTAQFRNPGRYDLFRRLQGRGRSRVPGRVESDGVRRVPIHPRGRLGGSARLRQPQADSVQPESRYPLRGHGSVRALVEPAPARLVPSRQGARRGRRGGRYSSAGARATAPASR